MIPDGFVDKINKRKKEIIEQNFTLKEAKRTRAFWMFGFALAFSSFFITGLTFYVISIFESVNYTTVEAISIFLPISIIAISVSTIANILSDYIAHKIYLFIMISAGFFSSLWFVNIKY